MIRKAIIVGLTLGAVGTGLLWLGSIGWSIVYCSRGYRHGIASGILAITYTDLGVTDDTPPDGWRLTRREERNWYPLAWLPRHGRVWLSYLSIVVPLWMPLIAFSIYPTIAFIRGPLRRWRRRRNGLCVKCGYDLTGNVTGVCSECGRRA